jgi:integrase
MRIGDVNQLKWTDIDLENGTVRWDLEGPDGALRPLGGRIVRKRDSKDLLEDAFRPKRLRAHLVLISKINFVYAWIILFT